MNLINIKINFSTFAIAFGFYFTPLFVTAQTMYTPQQTENTKSSPEITKNMILIQDFKNDLANIGEQKNNDNLKLSSLGGEVSGGGSTLFWKGQRKFLDVYFSRSRYQKAKKLNAQNFGSRTIERILLEHTELNDLIKIIFKRLTSISPTLSVSLKQVLDVIPFYFVNGKFKVLDLNIYLDPKYNYPLDAQLSTAAFNIKKIGVLISRDQFLEMDEFNQAALVIHELLRFLQIHLSLRVSNADIQNLTAALLDPNSNLKDAIQNSSLQLIALTSQEDQLIDHFQHLLVFIKQTYGISPSRSYEINEKNTTYFNLASIAAEVSNELINIRVANKLSLSDNEFMQLEQSEDEFDRIVVQLRSRGVRLIHAQSLNAMTQIVGALTLPQQDFIEYCTIKSNQDQICIEFKKIISELIN